MTNDALGRFNQSFPVPSLVTTMLPRMFPIVLMSTQGNVSVLLGGTVVPALPLLC